MRAKTRLTRHVSMMAAALLALSAAPLPKQRDAEPEPPAIEGSVLDAEGKPVGNATVEVYRAYPYPKQLESMKTGQDGRFRVPGHWGGTDESYTLIVRKPDKLGWCQVFQQTYQQKEGEKKVRIQLTAVTKKVLGTLVDSNGKPLVGVPVKIWSLNNKQNRWLSPLPDGILNGGKTDNKGAFTVVLPEGTAAWMWPSDPWFVNIRIGSAADADDIGEIKVPDGGQITGRVLDSLGKPVAGAHVDAQAQNNNVHVWYFAGGAPAITDADGRFRINAKLPGKYNVLFTPPESNIKLAAPAIEGIVVGARKETFANLTAAEGRLLTGRVVDAESGAGMSKCYVGYYGVARPRSGAAIIGCTTDAKGNFSLYVPPGAAFVYVSGGRFKRLDESECSLEVPERGEVNPLVLRVLPADAK